eukprot:Em0010g63a
MTSFFSTHSEWREHLLQLKYEELNAIPFGRTKDAWPSSLNEFVALSDKLCLDRTVPEWVKDAEVTLGLGTRCGLTPKKAHEVCRLAGVVKCVCHKTACQAVIDIGSGLGYLGRCLALECGVTVVGVEAKHEFTETAQRMMKDGRRKACNHPECPGIAMSCCHGDRLHPLEHSSGNGPSNVSVSLCLDGTTQSCEQMEELLHQIESEGVGVVKVGVVGLHCCGDLTPCTQELFLSHPSLRHLVLVGCCYHKMSQPPASGDHFPLSELLKGLMQAQGQCIVSTLALRLAAQETRERWRKQSDGNHSNHEKQMAFRAIAEAVVSDKGSSLNRKLIRQANYSDIGCFAESLSILMKDPSLKDALLTYHSTNGQFVAYVEPFTALQTCVQGVIEGLIVLDRCVFLWEQGLQAEMVPVFDEDISPRCIALLATR